MERPNRQGIQFTGNYIIIFRYIPDTTQRKTPAQDVTRQYQSGVGSDFLVMRNYQYLAVYFRIAVQLYNLGMFTMKCEHCKSQVGVRYRFDSCHLHQMAQKEISSIQSVLTALNKQAKPITTTIYKAGTLENRTPCHNLVGRNKG